MVTRTSVNFSATTGSSTLESDASTFPPTPIDTFSTSLFDDLEATDEGSEVRGAGSSIKSGNGENAGERGGVLMGVTARFWLAGEEEEDKEVHFACLGDVGAEFGGVGTFGSVGISRLRGNLIGSWWIQ